jgi:hypothetical protein
MNLKGGLNSKAAYCRRLGNAPNPSFFARLRDWLGW